MAQFSFKKLTDPVWEVEFPTGEEKKYDPWKLQADIEKAVGKSAYEAYDIVRAAFGYPKQSEVDASAEDPKPYTPTMNQCVELQAALVAYLNGLDVSKKLNATSAK